MNSLPESIKRSPSVVPSPADPQFEPPREYNRPDEFPTVTFSILIAELVMTGAVILCGGYFLLGRGLQTSSALSSFWGSLIFLTGGLLLCSALACSTYRHWGRRICLGFLCLLMLAGAGLLLFMLTSWVNDLLADFLPSLPLRRYQYGNPIEAPAILLFGQFWLIMLELGIQTLLDPRILERFDRE